MINDASHQHLVEQIQPRMVSSLFSVKSLRFAFLVSLTYLFLSWLLIGFRTDQLVLVFLFNGFYFAGWSSRKFILGFSFFMIYWIIFDYMKAFPNYRFHSVSIAELYDLEKKLFGFSWQGIVMTPNEFFVIHHNRFLDFLTGLIYLCWVPVPLIFAGILFFRNRRQFFYFTFSFLLVNLIGFIGYYLYPAAPPWYVSHYGFEFIPGTPGNTAGLARFDAITGAGIFESLYSKSSNVFAAMPSLHASYMLIVLYYGIRFHFRLYNIIFAFLLLGIWFSAVYNNHHYVLDIIAGAACGLAGIALFQRWMKTHTGKRMMNYLVSITS